MRTCTLKQNLYRENDITEVSNSMDATFYIKRYNGEIHTWDPDYNYGLWTAYMDTTALCVSDTDIVAISLIYPIETENVAVFVYNSGQCYAKIFKITSAHINTTDNENIYVYSLQDTHDTIRYEPVLNHEYMG